MMTQDRDYEDALRRALTAAAESIEPTGDGLQRIRHRLDSPRSPRSVLSGCAEWLELHGTRILVRLEPATDAAWAFLGRMGPLHALASFLRGLLGPRGRRRAGGHRGPASAPGRLGPAGAWLKPVFAIAAAVAIVMVGVVILNHESVPLISPANSVGSPSPGSGLSPGGTTSKSKRWKLPLGVSPTQPFTGPGPHRHMTSVLPAVACTPTPKPEVTTTAPAGGPTATPTPSVSVTASATPTPTATETTLPTPTPTATPATGNTASATTAALVVPVYGGKAVIVECGTSPKAGRTP